MRPKAQFIALLLLVFLVWNADMAGAGTPPPSKFDRFLNAVVVVRSSVGEGAGFFVNQDGLLVTNHHVVEDDTRVQIGLRDGRNLTGTVLAIEEDMDLALVAIPQASPAWLKLARPNEAGVGSDVIAIGTARGLSWSVSRGIISGLRDGGDFNIGQPGEVLLIQTDAAINPGNSGGPLILVDAGLVVGVNTITFKKEIAEGISFAVSSDNVRGAFTKYLAEDGQVPPPNPALTPEQQAKERLKLWLTDPQAAMARLTERKDNTPAPAPTQGRPNITLANAKKFTVDNKVAGPLLVVTGRSKNNDSKPRSYIRLTGTLHDAQGKVLSTKIVYSGNFLSDEELKTLPVAQIEQKLNVQSGIKDNNVNIPPGNSVTFMVVFDHVPSKAEEWAVKVTDVK